MGVLMCGQVFAEIRKDKGEEIRYPACAYCHETEVESYDATAHGKGNLDCAVCHGDARRHVLDPEAKGTLIPLGQLGASKAQGVCLACHEEKGKDVEERFTRVETGHENLRCFECHQAHLKGQATSEELIHFKESDHVDCAHCHKNVAGEVEHSPHAEGVASCADCHQVHRIENVSQSIEKEIERCMHCHPEQELEFKSMYTHPLRERQITCVGCHDPHSDRRPGMLRQEGDQVCGECHGDVLIEGGRHPISKETQHAFGSVRCVDCHKPHGSNFEAVLLYPSEELCHTCHR